MIFACKTEQAARLASQKRTADAPRLAASSPIEPVPPKTSKKAAVVRDEAKVLVYQAPQAYLAGPKSAPKVLVQPGHVGRNIVMKRDTRATSGGLISRHIVTVSNKQDGPYGARNLGVFLEYGINMPQPYPFMRRAYDGKHGEAVAAAKTIIRQEIDKLWGRS